jgi:hypothetical protein
MVRNMSSGERGEGKFGCFLTLLLIIAFVYIGIQALPVYLDRMDFEEGMARLASQSGVSNWNNQQIVDRIKALARSEDFSVEVEKIEIRRTTGFQAVPEIKIRVDYWREVEFPGYIHTFRFTSEVSSIIGRL